MIDNTKNCPTVANFDNQVPYLTPGTVRSLHSPSLSPPVLRFAGYLKPLKRRGKGRSRKKDLRPYSWESNSGPSAMQARHIKYLQLFNQMLAALLLITR